MVVVLDCYFHRLLLGLRLCLSRKDCTALECADVVSPVALVSEPVIVRIRLAVACINVTGIIHQSDASEAYTLSCLSNLLGAVESAVLLFYYNIIFLFLFTFIS